MIENCFVIKIEQGVTCIFDDLNFIDNSFKGGNTFEKLFLKKVVTLNPKFSLIRQLGGFNEH